MGMPHTGSQSVAVIVCRCSISRAVPEAALSEVLEVVDEYRGQVLIFEDLCGVAAGMRAGDGGNGFCKRLRQSVESADRILVAACAPRAVEALLDWIGLARPGRTQFVSLREDDAALRCREILASEPGSSPFKDIRQNLPRGKTSQGQDADSGDWVPWFPVIDRNRCVDCGKCLDFCLFGVYSDCSGRVEVTNPVKCKNKCPACARVCPVGAVIFPKFDRAPINGEEPAEVCGEHDMTSAAVEEKRARRRKLFTDDFEEQVGL